jgi:hypothetical protein
MQRAKKLIALQSHCHKPVQDNKILKDYANGRLGHNDIFSNKLFPQCFDFACMFLRTILSHSCHSRFQQIRTKELIRENVRAPTSLQAVRATLEKAIKH